MIAGGLFSAITLAFVANLQRFVRSSGLALLAGSCIYAWVTEARADCSSQGAEVVVPGTYQRAAPKNTRVFVTSTRKNLRGVELRHKDDGALVASRATSRVDAENGSHFFELVPNALLEPGKAYEVYGVLDGGSTKLAKFRVVDIMDETPPRLGEAALTLSRSGGYVQLEALVDDTTLDDNLRLLVWQGQQDPKKPDAPLPLADLLADRFSAGQAKYFLVGREDECNSRWHSYPETTVGAVYTLALVDQAGNVSAPRLVKLAEPYPPSKESAEPSLYYVPGAKLLVQGRTLVFAAVSALLAALALAFGLCSRRRRAA